MSGKGRGRRKPRARRSTAERRRVFLETYRRTGGLTIGADAAGISIETVNQWIRGERDFRTAFEEATMRFRERLDAEVLRRIEAGRDGVLLRFKLQAELPEKYGRAGKKVTVDSRLTWEEIERAAKGEEDEKAAEEALKFQEGYRYNEDVYR